MTALLVDTSILLKWFHEQGEAQVQESRTLLASHVAGELNALILDLAIYEIGNVLLRSLHWDSTAVADQLDDLEVIIGPAIAMTSEWLRHAAHLANAHGLSFYDASWAAAAQKLDVVLVSADKKLISSGLAESPADTVKRLRLGGLA